MVYTCACDQLGLTRDPRFYILMTNTLTVSLMTVTQMSSNLGKCFYNCDRCQSRNKLTTRDWRNLHLTGSGFFLPPPTWDVLSSVCKLSILRAEKCQIVSGSSMHCLPFPICLLHIVSTQAGTSERDISITLESPLHLMILGHSPDFGVCAATSKSGQQCFHVVNKYVSVFHTLLPLHGRLGWCVTSL